MKLLLFCKREREREREKKLLRLSDCGLFAGETFADLGKKRKNRKTFFRKHFLTLKYN